MTQHGEAETPPTGPATLESIEEMIAQGKSIGEQAVDLHEALLTSLASENVTFKRRNRVLVVMMAILLALTVLREWRATFQTVPLIDKTHEAVTHTIADKDRTIADQKIVIDQAVAAITQMAGQISDLGGTPPQVILDPKRDKR